MHTPNKEGSPHGTVKNFFFPLTDYHPGLNEAVFHDQQDLAVSREAAKSAKEIVNTNPDFVASWLRGFA
jgi:hypothetical protein